jgi:hypothetical protein
MLGSTRRPDRPKPARSRVEMSLEPLEGRQLLSSASDVIRQLYSPLYNGRVGTGHPLFVSSNSLETPNQIPSLAPVFNSGATGIRPQALLGLNNEGRVVTGKDRQGDEYQIVVHGPGAVIVTDTSPNDGVLDDDIDTIQIVGSNPKTTFVTGQTVASARVQTDGTVRFDHLIADNGVKSIILNGFTLARTSVFSAPNLNTGEPAIFLPGGVGTLSFHNIEAPIDLAANTTPFQIIIGQPNEPLAVRPTIHIDSIFNTVFDATALQNPNGTPPTAPTVQILVNGQIQSLDILSATQEPIQAAQQTNFPVVGTTGRTAVQALGINHLNVAGTARNFTASRQAAPFSSSFSGLNYLGTAHFGGVTDGVGLDVSHNGKIGKLQFNRGLGDPTGTSIASTSLGTPADQAGLASFGFLGGLVTAGSIGQVQSGPANLVLQTPQDPDFIQSGLGRTRYFARPGTALTSAAITSAKSIGSVHIVGSSQNSEIKSGFDYPSFTAGLEGTRAPSKIRKFQQNGDLVDAVVSATYRPANQTYGQLNAFGAVNDFAGPGTIKGNLTGSLANTGGQTALSNRGVGVFARRKIGNLPPPLRARRVGGVLVR